MSNRRVTYKDLTKRLERLALSLLPEDRPAGDYTEEDTDRIHAYVLLAHAELEEYFEKLAIYLADLARRKSNGSNCEPLVSRLILLRASQGKEKIETATAEAIASAVAFFEKVVERNLGIKSANVMQMFMPLGMSHIDLDPVLLANLDAFGRFRGDLAHTAARLRQGSSPSAEKARVTNILRDLSHFDERARTLV